MYRGKRAFGLLAALVAGVAAAVMLTVRQLPDELIVHRDGSAQLATILPVSVEINDSHADSARAKLFGVVGVKDVGLRRERPRKVMLAGTLFGLRMYSDGVMVVGLSNFESDGKKVNPAKDSGISRGDIIHSADGKRVYTNADFAEEVKKTKGSLTLELIGKDGKNKSVKLTPAYSDADGCLKTGMWVRDSAAGIGTLTYIDPEIGVFGGLGHGICDMDTHEIVPIHEGEIVAAQISSIRRGVRGSAGEIRGYLTDEDLGTLDSNTICGTFGKYTSKLPELKEYDVAVKQEIRQGKAKLLCTVTTDGNPTLYDVVINRINYGGDPAKNMIITVTDNQTGKSAEITVTVAKSGQHYVFMVPVAEELDLKKAAAAVGEKAVAMLKSKDLLPLTGYIHGGCSPIGMKKQFSTTIHASADSFETIIFSGGRIGLQVEMSLTDLARVVPFTLHSVTVHD